MTTCLEIARRAATTPQQHTSIPTRPPLVTIIRPPHVHATCQSHVAALLTACHPRITRRRHRPVISTRPKRTQRPNAGCLSVWSRLPCRKKAATIPTVGARGAGEERAKSGSPSPWSHRNLRQSLSDLLAVGHARARGTVLPVTVAAGGGHRPACPAEGL